MFAGSSQVNLYTLMPSVAFSAMTVGCREVGAGGGSVNFNTKLKLYGIAIDLCTFDYENYDNEGDSSFILITAYYYYEINYKQFSVAYLWSE